MALSALFCTCFCALAFGVAHADVASQKRARFGLKGLEYNVDGYDKHGYDVLGFDTEGYDTLGRPVTDEYAGTGTGMDCSFAPSNQRVLAKCVPSNSMSLSKGTLWIPCNVSKWTSGYKGSARR
jgi:hypothetical protein